MNLRMDVYHHFDSPPEDDKKLNAILKQLHYLAIQQELLMSKLDQSIADLTAVNDVNAANIAILTDAVNGVSGDIANLNAQIAALQAALPGITPEQQAALDAVVAAQQALSVNLAGQIANLVVVDAQTPPV
jgi:hypothetical protein